MRKSVFIVTSLLLMISAISTTAYGATSLNNHVSNLTPGHSYTPQQEGMTVIPAPPAGFNPLTASNQKLSLYGFPQRPTSASELTAWIEAMKAIKTFEPVSFTDSNMNFDVNNYGQYWSGKVDAGGSNFTDVHATWVVPGATEPLFSGAEDAQWVGIGGYYKSSAGVIQAGVYQGSGNNQLWFEVYPYQNAQFITNAYISNGDTLYTDVSYSGGYATFYLEDVTTGQVWRGTKEYVPTFYDGTTAEWIVEHVVNHEMADFHQVTFTAGGTNSATYGRHAIEDGQYVVVNDIAENSSTLDIYAEPNAMTSSTQFTDVWYNYQ